MCTLLRDHGVSPTHSCRIMCLICMVPRVHSASPTHSCCFKCIRLKQFQSVPISCNWLRPIHLTHLNIASPPNSNGASSLSFFNHPHYLIRLISFELFVIITLPPLSCQGIKIILYIRIFLEWIETRSLGGKLQSQNVVQVTGPKRYTCYVIDFTLELPSSAMRVFSLGSFSLLSVVPLLRLVVLLLWLVVLVVPKPL
jgi:hypothetical protein